MKLHDFSEVYGIKESALRYWEKAGILSAKRMENQKYRDLSTNISRLLYLDILYYRKNGVAVKDMTDFDKMDEEQIYEMLERRKQTRRTARALKPSAGQPAAETVHDKVSERFRQKALPFG